MKIVKYSARTNQKNVKMAQTSMVDSVAAALLPWRLLAGTSTFSGAYIVGWDSQQ